MSDDLAIVGMCLGGPDWGNVRIGWGLRGPEGAVHFVYGDWGPGSTPEDRAFETSFLTQFGHTLYPMGMDVGYHSPVPHGQYQVDQGPADEACDWLDGQACYGDGSALRARELMELWIQHDRDLEFLITMLRVYYEAVFRSDGNGPLELGEMMMGLLEAIEAADNDRKPHTGGRFIESGDGL